MSDTLTPGATPQNMLALKAANRVRIARAELKRAIANRERTAAGVLLAVPFEARTMAIGELLKAQPRWGNTRVRRFLGPHGIREDRTIEQLTDRQRALLVGCLRPGAGGLMAALDEALAA